MFRLPFFRVRVDVFIYTHVKGGFWSHKVSQTRRIEGAEATKCLGDRDETSL